MKRNLILLLTLSINHLYSIDVGILKETNLSQIKIILSGEDGVSYFLRDSQDLKEWDLVYEEPIQNQNEITLSADQSRNFFTLESKFERRARLFIQNYKKQLINGGPKILNLNNNEVQSTITIEENRINNEMVITANGIPNYLPTILGIDVTNGFSGENYFKEIKLTENNLGASGNNNPNQIILAEEIFIIPLEPVYNENTADTSLGTVGVAINGIPIYNPFEDQNETAAYGRIFSSCCGHPQLNGIYHYHKYPTCLRYIDGDNFKTEKEKCDSIDQLIENGNHSPLIGFALDGWPIYGPVGWTDEMRNSELLSSSYTGLPDSSGNPAFIENSGDLDVCNGIDSPTPEFPEGIYHYVMSVKSNPDGTVFRYLNPHFGYDIRSTLNKHSVMPSAWEDDSTYIDSLKSGFVINGLNIPGTDTFSTFILFIKNMQNLLRDNNYSYIADEFETMQIEYPYTIRRYRGNPSPSSNSGNNQNNNDNNEDTRNFEINPSNVIPSENFSGSGIVQINLNNVAGPPLPRNLIRVRIGALELSNINLENNMVEGSFNGLSEGIYDVTATFRTPNGTIFNYTAEQSFSVFIVN